MINFKLCGDGKFVFGFREDGAMVSYSIEAEEYKQWLSEGNTPEPQFTDEELAANQKAKAVADAKSVLSSTDWIITKYTDLVVVQKLMTDAEFNTKYATELAQRNDAREALK
jgi:hypothetical protein